MIPGTRHQVRIYSILYPVPHVDNVAVVGRPGDPMASVAQEPNSGQEAIRHARRSQQPDLCVYVCGARCARQRKHTHHQ